MYRVKVEVPFSSGVVATVDVQDKDDIEEVRERLQEFDPSLADIPDFYEVLGSSWRHMVEQVKPCNIVHDEKLDGYYCCDCRLRFNLTIIESTQAVESYGIQHCPACGGVLYGE